MIKLVLTYAIAYAAPTNITIRTEEYPRPPYSGARYYIYESGGQVICTKLKVCNKFDDCTVEYKAGAFRDEEDQKTGAPYGSTPPIRLTPNRWHSHECLRRFDLIP